MRVGWLSCLDGYVSVIARAGASRQPAAQRSQPASQVAHVSTTAVGRYRPRFDSVICVTPSSCLMCEAFQKNTMNPKTTQNALVLGS